MDIRVRAAITHDRMIIHWRRLRYTTPFSWMTLNISLWLHDFLPLFSYSNTFANHMHSILWILISFAISQLFVYVVISRSSICEDILPALPYKPPLPHPHFLSKSSEDKIGEHLHSMEDKGNVKRIYSHSPLSLSWRRHCNRMLETEYYMHIDRFLCTALFTADGIRR